MGFNQMDCCTRFVIAFSLSSCFAFGFLFYFGEQFWTTPLPGPGGSGGPGGPGGRLLVQHGLDWLHLVFF